MAQNKLPDWLAIIGQSGAGKGSASKYLLQSCKTKGIKTLHIDTGDLFRKTIASGSYLGKKMETLQNQGSLQPQFVAASLWFSKMLDQLTENCFVIHEGSPRYYEQFILMQSLVHIGYFNSLKVLEIQASDKICKERLIVRTMQEKRLDTSKDGEPGVPDMTKIATKMEWWTTGHGEILRLVKEAGAYLSVDNEKSKDYLEYQLRKLFFPT